MFTKLEPLEKSKHQELRLNKIQDFNFARKVSAVQLSFSEIQQASLFYPIIFPSDGSNMPTALLSLTENTNHFIDEKGQWRVPYLPLFFRFYPFTLIAVEKEKDQHILCIDKEAEHFKAGQGEPMFTADGQPNEFVQGLLKGLTTYHNELATTRILFSELAENGLIVDRKIDFELKGQPKSVDGFKAVDMEKLIAMDDKTIAGLVKKGTMSMVYSHLYSLPKVAALAQFENM